ncbi:MAG: hypothetical protein HKN33_09325 [Pyrinomonadaceae bacterium]|nr:hypothetical protein [Pyrinomonadaceae bacterium]
MNKLNRTITSVFVMALAGTVLFSSANAQFIQDPGRYLKRQDTNSRKSNSDIRPMPTRTISASAAAISEVRPFDFNDSYYSSHGIIPSMINKRYTGSDKGSVTEGVGEKDFSNVRIKETFPLANAKGFLLYYAQLGTVHEGSFVDVPSQKAAGEMAEDFPMYAFPSSSLNSEERQARIGDFGNEYWDLNPLGISILIDVTFTDQAFTKAGGNYLETVLGPNGVAEDGTFRIRTLEEVNDLFLGGYLQKTPRLDEQGRQIYVINRVMRDPQGGAVANDAFLTMIQGRDSKPLSSEMNFQNEFDCLRSTGTWCS